MVQHGAGKKPGRKRSGKKKAAHGRETAPRKRSIARTRTRSESLGSSAKGAWSRAREEQHRLKREAILRVASRLLNRKGYAGMSLTDIADELDIRNASLYYYFESKADLVFACFERAQRIVSETVESVEKGQWSGLEAIERYAVSIIDHMRDEGELPLAPNVWALDRAHMKVILTAELEHVRRIAGLIERGIADGSIRPCNVPLTTTMLSSAMRSVPGHYLSVDPEQWPDLDEEVLTAIRHFLSAAGE